jgi:hypothetical protein
MRLEPRRVLRINLRRDTPTEREATTLETRRKPETETKAMEILETGPETKSESELDFIEVLETGPKRSSTPSPKPEFDVAPLAGARENTI